jgi:sulfate adenylyltransferase (ADP) / ATP adenylyltransferase
VSRVQLEPGTLWPAIVRHARQALACGAMRPIATQEGQIDDGGVKFLVRVVSSLAQKDAAIDHAAATPADPFLPYDRDLFVADVSATHLVVLNKFNVINHHVLIVTRDFVSQEAPLDGADCAALAACLREFEGLAFYNGGTMAGASQAHKHLQVIPLPIAQAGPPVPIEALFGTLKMENGVYRLPAFNFRHAFAWIEPTLFEEVDSAAARLLDLYKAMLAATGVEMTGRNGNARDVTPYNLLLTRRWMLLVPRSKEKFESISVNALGFAGSLFVRNERQMQTLTRAGPMNVLHEVSIR